jgi:hypothetical protein
MKSMEIPAGDHDKYLVIHLYNDYIFLMRGQILTTFFLQKFSFGLAYCFHL